MTVEAALTHWHQVGAGCSVWLGAWSDLAAAETALTAAQVPVTRLNQALLAQVPDATELAATELRGGTAAVRRTLADAFAAWSATTAAESGPLAIRDFELLFAARLDLLPLAGWTRPVLLLAPGRVVGRQARLYADDSADGWPLPPGLAASDRVVDLTGGEA